MLSRSAIDNKWRTQPNLHFGLRSAIAANVRLFDRRGAEVLERSSQRAKDQVRPIQCLDQFEFVFAATMPPPEEPISITSPIARWPTFATLARIPKPVTRENNPSPWGYSLGSAVPTWVAGRLTNPSTRA